MFFVLTAIRFQNNTVVFRGNGKDILGRSLVGTHVLLKGIVAYLPSRIVATMLLTEENWKTLYLKRDSNADYVMADEEIAQSASTPTADFSPGSDDLSSPSFIGNLLPAVSGRNQVDDLAVATDRYELREQIAGGGMGVIYSAHDRVLDREVAVKVLRPEFRSSPNHVRRFVSRQRLSANSNTQPFHRAMTLAFCAMGSPFWL